MKDIVWDWRFTYFVIKIEIYQTTNNFNVMELIFKSLIRLYYLGERGDIIKIICATRERILFILFYSFYYWKREEYEKRMIEQ